MNPDQRVNFIGQLAASLRYINPTSSSAGQAHKNIIKRIEELSADTVLSHVDASPSIDAERADIELFLWLRSCGLNIIDVAMELVTPEGQLTPRERAHAAVDVLIERERDHQLARRKLSEAQSVYRNADNIKDEAWRKKTQQADHLKNSVEVMIKNELNAPVAGGEL